MNAVSSIVAAEEYRLDDPVLANAAIHVGLVRLGGRDLALRAECVREVVPLPQQLQPAFTRCDGLAGSIVVRGQVIPVVDVSHLLGFDDEATGPGAVVVVRHDENLIGLFVHAVSGLMSVRASDIQPFLFTDAQGQQVVKSSFSIDDRLVGVVDPAAILALPGMPRARAISRTGQDAMLVGQMRLLVLSAAGAELALEATFVVATMPGTQVRPAPGVGDEWAGVIDYLDLEVPVIEDIGLLGLSGRTGDGAGALVVIVRLAENELLGIKADHVHRIMSVHERDIRPFPHGIAARLPLFTGAVANGSGGQSMLLSSTALAENAPLRMIAALTHRKGNAGPGTAALAAGQEQQNSDRQHAGAALPQPYLVFRTGARRKACPLAEISQIIPLPHDHGRLSSPGSPLRGFISHAGAPVALVDLGEDEVAPLDPTQVAARGGGPAAPGTGDRMVLIVNTGECATGFIVDQLETIARALAQTMPPRAGVPVGEEGSFIQTRFGGRDEAVRICRLADEIERLSASADSTGRTLACASRN
ncbi:MAG TPA: chemotaxis protein CheW [Sphingomonas sp.]|nr:chemotaxis protein CheW [Sphingomonas sp.]